MVREDDLFFMNNKNTVGKLGASESGSAAYITDDGEIVGEPEPSDFWDKLQAMGEDFFNDTIDPIKNAYQNGENLKASLEVVELIVSLYPPVRAAKVAMVVK